ncbi:MAG: hypothetical protein NT031_14190, partial [Planctomycetota bacterium]|nr:hypothetical protein [Planctomycetota bacterium]
GRSPHNTIGAIGAYAGLPGWLLFFGALFMGVVRLRRVSKLPIPEADFRIVLAGWGFYLMQIVWIFTDELIFVKHFWLLFAANIGYMNWLERTYGHPAPLPVRHAPATPMRRPPATRPAGGEL